MIEHEQESSSRRARARPTTRPPKAAWVAIYTRRLLLTDSLAIIVAVGGSHLLWFGVRDRTVDTANDEFTVSISYLVLSLLLVLGWLGILRFYGTRDARIVGSGLTEYARTADASARFFGVVAIVALLLKIDIARGYLIVAFPVGLVLLIASRWGWRQWLRERRYAGFYLVRVLLVGSPESVEHLAGELARAAYAGYRVVGICLSKSADDHPLDIPSGIPVYRSLSELPVALKEVDAHTVALAGSDGLPPRTVRNISWQLETTGVELMVAPSIADIAGTRIHTRPVAGLPLIYVESPRYEGPARAVKAAFDFFVTLVLVILASPLLIVVAIVVKVSSRGPVLYRQERVGLNGEAFDMLKFRSMKVGADAELAELLKGQESDGEPLFKVKNDPRVTKVGGFIRAYSLDELPQLFNVLKGDMSLVGPRPQRAEEVALYDHAANRRLLVKPGITGLWQISGRSDLSWSDALRLDLFYVENWSLTDDMIILLRTARAVLRRSGAY